MNKFLGGILILFLVLPGVLAGPPACVAVGNTVCYWPDLVAAWKDWRANGGTKLSDVIKAFLLTFIAVPGLPNTVSLPFLTGVFIFGMPLLWFYALIAAAAMWMIVYGFLKELRIFRRSKNLYPWIALMVTLAAFPTHIIGFIVNFMLTNMGYWSVFMFGLIFFVGTWRYMQVFNRGMTTRAAMAGLEADRLSSLKRDLAELREARSELFEQMTEPGISAKKQAQLAAQIDKIDKRIQQMHAQIDQAEESASTPTG